MPLGWSIEEASQRCDREHDVSTAKLLRGWAEREAVASLPHDRRRGVGGRPVGPDGRCGERCDGEPATKPDRHELCELGQQVRARRLLAVRVDMKETDRPVNDV
jgi:hypothetical protein